ncbi:hypothetical protein L227DRAFT_657205 [Lentinus tigrinus ALCF2SS1-6]|uniref:BTB domain-containing protein n=1 Tax=Lentinus tigrinus ALCF2SS1-6 TaxID=1328759 RepID=A0A5C2RVL0_9APHY|nr:hypothetical protein L227DRAFT_657205 [Lentinus tigrinus ALCF2SS1-6]
MAGGQLTPEDMFDGLPVVRMPDAAYDIEQFFVVVYDGYISEGARRDIHTVVDFAVFAAWLRVGHKYHIQALALEAIRGFRSIFPMDLSTWTRYHFEFDGSFSHPRVRFETPQAIEAVNVIRQTCKVHLLPCALYTCAQLPRSVLFPGITRADGSLEMLSSADLQLCFEMKELLRATEPQIAVRWLTHAAAAKTCIERGDCTKEQKRMLMEVCRDLQENMRGDSLHGWDNSRRLYALGDEWAVCVFCGEAMAPGTDLG